MEDKCLNKWYLSALSKWEVRYVTKGSTSEIGNSRNIKEVSWFQHLCLHPICPSTGRWERHVEYPMQNYLGLFKAWQTLHPKSIEGFSERSFPRENLEVDPGGRQQKQTWTEPRRGRRNTALLLGWVKWTGPVCDESSHCGAVLNFCLGSVWRVVSLLK